MSERENMIDNSRGNCSYQKGKSFYKKQEAEKVCEWRIVDADNDEWVSFCGVDFVIIEGSLKDNNMTYCCGCGKKIKEIKEQS